jgi:hypothetical protein
MTTLRQLSFAGGELAPALYGRVDQAKYRTGLKTLRNMFVRRHGGISNRAGTQFIAEVSDSSKVVRLVPFIFNADQTYVLEFGENYFRVYKDGVQLTEATKAISAITNADPCVVTTATHGYTTGDEVYITGITGAIGQYLNNRNFKVTVLSTTTFSLQYMDGSTDVDSTSFGSYTSGGTSAKIYQVTTTYAEADLLTLDYVQSADVLTVVHPTYVPREIARTGDTSWTITNLSFAPAQAAPTSPTNSDSGSGGDTWVITAVNSETFEESLASSTTVSNAAASSGTPIDVSWSAASGAGEYNVYKLKNGLYGYIGTAGGTTFEDNGIVPDISDTPPTARNPFNASGDYPASVMYIQQRLTFASTTNDPEKVWMSRTGQYKNFTVSSPIQDDDAITFSLVGRQVNSVKHLLDLGKFLVMTQGGEWSIEGDEAGNIRPSQINARQNSYSGSADLPPIIVANSALFVQARGTVVRDLLFDASESSYKGNDLTIFSSHLFDGFTIVDWAYQQVPYSIIWAVRSDGKLLGLTYVREHQIWGWHRHDTDGTVERVTVVPEGNEDFLYMVVKRTINGSSVRYIEKLTTREIADLTDMKFMDANLSYDGRHTGSTTMTLSGGTDWTYDETITLTASASTFDSDDVGNAVHLYDSTGDIIRFTIVTYSSATVVTGKPNKTVPASLQGTAASSWILAVDTLQGLWHIEGEDVSVFADDFVVASPNNDTYTTVTVTNGQITLDRPYGVIHVGLPYISDMETLDIDSVEIESILPDKMIVHAVGFYLETSRGVWAGPRPPTSDTTDPLESLDELKIREEEGYDDPVSLLTDKAVVNIESEWNSNGRVFVRQVDPIPLSVLAVAPIGNFPFKGL